MDGTTIERLRDALAVVVCNAELALAMDGPAARDRLERAVAAAWRLDALLPDPDRAIRTAVLRSAGTA